MGDTDMIDIERYKADMARARDAGITFAAIRDIMSAHADDGPDGETFGRMVERIRELALQAAAEMASEDRAAVVAWLRESANAPHPIERGVPSLSPAGRGLLLLHADIIERGEHRREEEER